MNFFRGEIPFQVFILFQILSFLFIIISISTDHFQYLKTIFFIVFQLLIYVTYYIKKKKTYFYLLWEFQIFAFVFNHIIINFQYTFHKPDAQLITILVFACVLIFIEIIIVIYAIYKEKMIKRILFLIASSTSFFVLLIVIFVSSEGLHTFYENDPIQVLTGTTWQPFYEPGHTNSTYLITTVEPYSFTLDTEAPYYLFHPAMQRNLSITIENTGAYTDEITLTIQGSPELHLWNTSHVLHLNASEQNTIQFSIQAPQNEGIYFILAIGSSNTTSTIQSLNISCRISKQGVLLTPRFQQGSAQGNEGVMTGFPITIHNYGTINETYLVSIQAPPIFSPSLSGDNITWDYATSSTEITLKPNETQYYTLQPRIRTKTTGIYQLILNVTSRSNPKITAESIVDYKYRLHKQFYTITPTQQSIGTTDEVTYTLQLHNIDSEFDINIENVTSNWHTTLIQNNTILLNDNGQYHVDVNTSFQDFSLKVSVTDGNNGDNSKIKISIGKLASTPTFGILPFIVGTILTTIIALCIAAPVGLSCAIFLAEFCPSKIRNVLRPLYELLAGIPSIIYGLWGFFTFGPWLADKIYPLITATLGQFIPFFSETTLMGRSILTASIVLGIMILPIIITLSEDAIRVVPQAYREGSLAAGATKWQTLRKIVLPSASSGIISSIILATGRAIGETMAVLMIMAYAPIIPQSIFDSGATMTSVIAALLGSTFNNDLTRHALFAIGLVLFCMVFALNIIIVFVQKRMNNQQKKQRKKTLFSSLKKISLQVSLLMLAITPSSAIKKKEKQFTIISENTPKHKIKKFQILSNSEKTRKQNSEKNTMNGVNKKSFIDKQQTYLTVKKAIQAQKIAVILLIFIALLVSIFLFWILGDVLFQGIPTMRLEFLYLPDIGLGVEGGFANAIVGSLALVTIAVVIAAPLAIGAAIYVEEYAKSSNVFTKIILFASDTLASTPSIVFGGFGFIFFVWYLGFGISLLAGGVTLALMILPLLLRSSIEAIKSIPQEFREGSLALGASQWKTITHVVLPPAVPMIISGLIISIGRAIGETAAIIFTVGYSTYISTGLLEGAGSLPLLIFKNYSLASKEPVLEAKMYSAALVLISIVLLFNILSRYISNRSSKMMKF